MRYISLFSGIEAASVAWGQLGWEPVAFAEVDPFPAAVLAHRFPDVPNLGDMTKVDWSEYHGKADVVIGGFPCQSFSIAGRRGGIADPRGSLMLEFFRVCREIGPEWVVGENVPGLLSSGKGADFQALLEAVAQLWPDGGCAWRVLDAQFWRVAQRRRRLFVVVNARDWERAARVLQEPEGLRGNRAKGREEREALARAFGYRAPYHRRWRAAAGTPEHEGVAGLVGGRTPPCGSLDCADKPPPLNGDGPGAIAASSVSAPMLKRDTASGSAPLAFVQGGGDAVRVQGDGDVTGTLPASSGSKQTTYVMQMAYTRSNGSGVSEDDVAYTLDCSHGNAVCTQFGDELAGALTARHNSSANAAGGQNVVCLAGSSARAAVDSGVAGAMVSADDPPPLCHPLMCHPGPKFGGPSDPAYTLTAREGGGGGVDGAVAVVRTVTQGADARAGGDVPPPLQAPCQKVGALDPAKWIVRALTPVECERLQGFPDGWTDLSGCDADAVAGAVAAALGAAGGKERAALSRKVGRWSRSCPDGPRYRACGNSMAVPVIEWIGRRIEEEGSEDGE